MSAFVALDGVSHAYGAKGGSAGGTMAVDGLSIAVNAGEFAAVVGPSGCGKSTLMKLATGLQFPFKGEVRVGARRSTTCSCCSRSSSRTAFLISFFPLVVNVATGLSSAR